MHFSETLGCGATIRLDNGETCRISCAQSGVLVKSYRGRFAFFGAKLYEETAVYEAAKTAMALDVIYPKNELPFGINNPVLKAFANAIWQCQSAAQVTILINRAKRIRAVLA